MQTFLLFPDQRYETVLIFALNKNTPPFNAQTCAVGITDARVVLILEVSGHCCVALRNA